MRAFDFVLNFNVAYCADISHQKGRDYTRSTKAVYFWTIYPSIFEKGSVATIDYEKFVTLLPNFENFIKF